MLIIIIISVHVWLFAANINGEIDRCKRYKTCIVNIYSLNIAYIIINEVIM